MKVCIIGKNSYIGNHIDKWLTNHNHQVFQLDVLIEDWKNYDYSSFDVVIQVAGIVHQPKCKDADLYKRINTDMPIEIAKIFKGNNKTQYKSFIFLSTMAVYGTHKRLRKNLITINTPTNPTSLYGKSKKSAEEGLLEMQDSNFNVVIVRPPNVYGKNCKGGYIKGFVNVVKKLPIIPQAYTEVKQSMLYIDNLCEFIRLSIEQKRHGIFMPQDEKAVSAIEIISEISTCLGKTIRTSKMLGLIIHLFNFIPLIQKAYGGVEYDKKLSDIEGMNYAIVSFKDAMKRTII